MTNSINLDTISNDIVLEIIKYLSLSDLSNLRLTNKKLFDITTCKYAMRLFKPKIIIQLKNMALGKMIDFVIDETIDKIFRYSNINSEYDEIMEIVKKIEQTKYSMLRYVSNKTNEIRLESVQQNNTPQYILDRNNEIRLEYVQQNNALRFVSYRNNEMHIEFA